MPRLSCMFYALYCTRADDRNSVQGVISLLPDFCFGHNSLIRQRLWTFLCLHRRTQTRLHVRVGGWGVAQTLVCVCQTQDRRVLEVSASHHHADGQVCLTAAESSVDCQCRVSCGVRCKHVVRVSRMLTQVFCTQSETRCMLTAINADSFTLTTTE